MGLLFSVSCFISVFLFTKVGVRIPGRVKSKTEKLAPAASLVSVHHLRARAELIGPVSV